MVKVVYILMRKNKRKPMKVCDMIISFMALVTYIIQMKRATSKSLIIETYSRLDVNEVDMREIFHLIKGMGLVAFF